MDEHAPSIEVQRNMVLSMVRAVLGTQRYTYLSGPITTGRRFIDWQRDQGRMIADQDQWRRERTKSVILPSCDVLFREAERTRASGRQVIDPGSFETGERPWPEQDDYYQLWDRVITHHADDVRFIDGWQFSAGCVLEYGYALKCGRPTYSVDGQELPKATALTVIAKAVDELRDDDPKIGKIRADIIRYCSAIEAA